MAWSVLKTQQSLERRSFPADGVDEKWRGSRSQANGRASHESSLRSRFTAGELLLARRHDEYVIAGDRYRSQTRACHERYRRGCHEGHQFWGNERKTRNGEHHY